MRHVAQFSPLLDDTTRANIARSPPHASIKELYQREGHSLSELQAFLDGKLRLDVPVYTVWGACEDVAVIEKLRGGEYNVQNLHIIDEAHSQLLEVGEVKLRLLGLGGALVMHKLFDNGEGRSTIAGGQGTMWSTLLQMGELLDNANRCYDPTETRVFITHASPAREGLLNQLSVALKADFSISAGLHFRYGSSYNEFSVNPSVDHYRGKLAAARASFYDVWETVKHEVMPAVAENEPQQQLLQQALDVINKMPTSANPDAYNGNATGQVDEAAFKNMWNFNLADAAFGFLVLDVNYGRIATEMRAQGFNFAHRVQKAPFRGMAGAEPTGRGLPAGQQQHMPHHQQQQMTQRTQQRSTGPSGAPIAQSTSRISSVPPGHQPSAPKAFQQQQQPGQAGQKHATNSASRPTLAERIETPSAQTEQSPRNAIYVPYAESMGECSNNAAMQELIFSATDINKIDRTEMIQKTRNGQPSPHWIVHFQNTETMLEVLARSPRPRAAGEQELTKLRISEFRPSSARGGRGGHQTAHWGPRGGTTAASNGGRPSGSENENTRGGRGGRGGSGSVRGRGDGRGRGGRGGRGGGAPGAGADGAGSDAKPAAAASTPQPAGGDA